MAASSAVAVLSMVVVISFLFVLGTNGRMQPVVMAPKNLSTKHYELDKVEGRDNTAEENTREKQKKDPRERRLILEQRKRWMQKRRTQAKQSTGGKWRERQGSY